MGGYHVLGLKVLVVEDDPGVSDVVAAALRRAGFLVIVCREIRQANVALERGSFDAAVVDLVLPDGNGLDLIAELGARMPMIAISGELVTDADRVLGLHEGADDYLVKPFSMTELVARVQAVIRRQARATTTTGRLRFGDLEVNLTKREVWMEDRLVRFTRKEFDLLGALARRPGRACSYEEIVRWVWGTDPSLVNPRSVTEHVRRIRRKLGDTAYEARWIATVPGVGYRFEGDRVEV